MSDEKAPLDSGRPYGTTREELLLLHVDAKMQRWIEEAEARFGLLERLSSVTMKDQRIIMLARFERAWCADMVNPGNPPGDQELQCFLTPETMVAFWGLFQYLTTAQTADEMWAAFEAAMQPLEDTAHENQRTA